MVPIVRDADQKGLAAIAGEVKELAGRVRTLWGCCLKHFAGVGTSCCVVQLGRCNSVRHCSWSAWHELRIHVLCGWAAAW